MNNSTLELPSTVLNAFNSFRADPSCLALLLHLIEGTLAPSPPIQTKDPNITFQSQLDEINKNLNTRTSLYLLMRRNNTLTAITFVPFLAKEDQKSFFLNHRHDLVRQLGPEHFCVSIICKEVGEITDIRSWEERDSHLAELDTGNDNNEQDASAPPGVRDLGYKRNACRLCDRRMTNAITPEALVALRTLDQPESAVQITVDPETLSLTLLFAQKQISPSDLPSLLPTTHPTFTFYRHPTTHLLYFIFHSPDSARVRARMAHTMAIPGLVNVHAESVGVRVEKKLEVHEGSDVMEEFENVARSIGNEKNGEEGAGKQGADGRIGRFRSVYLRGEWKGTESLYEGLERDKAFYDKVTV